MTNQFLSNVRSYTPVLQYLFIMDFHIKIFVRADEAENTLHTFYKHSVLWGQPQYALLISDLYYAYSMLEIAEST